LPKRILAGIALLAVVAGFLVAMRIGAGLWERRTAGIRAQMQTAAAARPVGGAELPEVVRRYLDRAAPGGRAPVTTVRLSQEGEFRMGETGENWVPFHSTQFVTTNPPAFDWDARIRMMPGVWVYVRDGYAAGRGELKAAVLGLINVAHAEGSKEIAEGQLIRYLAEAPWYPTVLLPGQGVEWAPLSDTSARAALRDGDVSATVDFHFGEDGLIREVSSLRGREAGGAFIQTPWSGRFWEYERREGMLIPMNGEVEWRLASGPRPYWRGRITELICK
jgi:hypothetical protein